MSNYFLQLKGCRIEMENTVKASTGSAWQQRGSVPDLKCIAGTNADEWVKSPAADKLFSLHFVHVS